VHQRRGEGKVLIFAQTYSKQRLKSQKGWQWAGDKPLPEIEQVVVHKAHLLSHWATSKVKRCYKIEKQSANLHNTLAARAHWGITDLAPEKGGKAKKQALSNQAQWKPSSKAGQLVDNRADLGTWGQHTNLNGHMSLREELTKQLPLKDKRKRKKTTQSPGKTTT
jgi:hypothetical protein